MQHVQTVRERGSRVGECFVWIGLDWWYVAFCEVVSSSLFFASAAWFNQVFCFFLLLIIATTKNKNMQKTQTNKFFVGDC